MKNEITDIFSLNNAIVEANDKFNGQLWWRGHQCIKWKLTPSVFRAKNSYHYEQNIIRRFMLRAHPRYPNTPPIDDKPRWLFLMQHYRLPTRLLDWTESPLIALFFAIEEITNVISINENTGEKIVERADESDGSLIVLNPYYLNKNQLKIDGLLSPEDNRYNELISRAFSNRTKDEGVIVALQPIELNLRMMLQLSVFTIHGKGLSIEDLSDNKEFILKYIIPKESKNILRENLKHLGIRKSILFPELDYLAEEISKTEFKAPSTILKTLGKTNNNSKNNLNDIMTST